MINDFCIAIDGGTSNTRARLLKGPNLISVSARAVGVRDVAMSGSSDPLRHAVSQCVREAIETAAIQWDQVALVCASGMLTSNVGLREVPHVSAPAGLDELARHVVATPFPQVAPKPLHLIPGIKTQPELAKIENLAQLDILRGEESEAMGILAATGRTGPLCILLPGSHTKLLHVDSQSRITASCTTIAGELMQAIAQHTILASSIDWPPPGDPDCSAVDAGGQFARQWGLARGAFAVRLADVLSGASRTARTWFFVGLIAGNDWNELSRWPPCNEGTPLLVGGREPLRTVYAYLGRTMSRSPVEVLNSSIVDIAAARGAIAIAWKSRSITTPGALGESL